MKKYAWYASLGILGTGALGASTACTVTTSSGDDSGIVSVNEGGVDTGNNADTGTDAANCGNLSFGSAVCDTCVQAHCCARVATCDTADDAGVDDAGFTSCEQLLACTFDLASVDGGTVDDAFSTCIGGVGGMNYTPSQQTVTRAVLDCATTNCLAMCQ